MTLEPTLRVRCATQRRVVLGFTVAAALSACTNGEAPQPRTDACAYPDPPYGILPGEQLSDQLAWEGFRARDTEDSVLRATDYFDCDGLAGSSALQLVQVVSDCATCQRQALEMTDALPTGWEARGIRVLILVARNGDGSPSTLETARRWRDDLGAGVVDVAADPNFTFASTDGLPRQIIVDPRTMTVVAVEPGYDGTYAVVDALSSNNAR